MNKGTEKWCIWRDQKWTYGFLSCLSCRQKDKIWGKLLWDLIFMAHFWTWLQFQWDISQSTYVSSLKSDFFSAAGSRRFELWIQIYPGIWSFTIHAASSENIGVQGGSGEEYNTCPKSPGIVLFRYFRLIAMLCAYIYSTCINTFASIWK